MSARTSPSFENIDLLPPPVLIEGKEDVFLKQISQYMQTVNQWSQELDLAVRSGWLVNNARVISITAEKILANSIFTQDLFIGAEQKIQLLGTTDTIDVYDSQATPELRTRIGKLGAGGDNYGQQWWDSSGTLIMEVGDTVFIDGIIISDGTILNEKIAANEIEATKLNITQLSAITADLGTITAGTIAATVSISAPAIDTGTLTADGSPVAIEITGSGALLFKDGGDAIFRSNTTNFAFIEFQNSSSTQQGQIKQLGTNNGIQIQSASGKDIELNSGSDINIDADLTSGIISITGDRIQISAALNSGINIETDNSFAIGTASKRLSDIRSVLVNGADIGFDNESYFTEPYMIWAEETMQKWNIKPDDGIVYVTNDEVAQIMFGKNGITMRDNLPPIDKESPTIESRKKQPEVYNFKGGVWTKTRN